MAKIKIIEVGPRDGLQNENLSLSVRHRYQLIQKLAASGLKHIEVGAFVSPRWVPQMSGTDKVVKKVFSAQAKGILSKTAHFSTLVPNLQGFEAALKTSIKEIAIFGACSESFSSKNINCSIKESFSRFESIISEAQKHKIKVRGYLSTAFGCPYEGKVPLSKVVGLTQQMLALGVYEVSVGDTIGVATPKQVRELVKKLDSKVDLKKIAMHFHNTRGTALANVLASLDLGITGFDSSVGGLGGCPYAEGASGNLATEDLVYMLEGMAYKTNIDRTQLIAIKKWVEKLIGRSLP